MGTACKDKFIVLQAYTAHILLAYFSRGTTSAEGHTPRGPHFKKTNWLQWGYAVT